MKTFNKSIHTLFICFILAQGIIPIEAAINETNLHHRAFANELINIVRSQIHYPSSAVSEDAEGKLTIKVKIDEQGNTIAMKLIQPSGTRKLDHAVMRLIRRIQYFKKIPKEFKLKEFNFEVPLNFILLEKNGGPSLTRTGDLPIMRRREPLKFSE